MKTCIFIAGMHRTGTSALAGLIDSLGVSAGNNLLEANEENEKGFYENTRLLEFNDAVLASAASCWDDIFWHPSKLPDLQTDGRVNSLTRILDEEYGTIDTVVIKDPRLCLLLPLYIEALKIMDVDCHILITLRHPLEVAKSLEKRNHFSHAKGLLLWCQYMLNIERDTRFLQRLIIPYDDLLSNPDGILLQIAATFGLDKALLASANSTSHIDPSLRHHDGSTLSTASPYASLADQIYRQFRYNTFSDAQRKQFTESLHGLLMRYATPFHAAEEKIRHITQKYYTAPGCEIPATDYANRFFSDTEQILEHNAKKIIDYETMLNRYLEKELDRMPMVEPPRNGTTGTVAYLQHLCHVMQSASRHKILVYGCSPIGYILAEALPENAVIGFIDPMWPSDEFRGYRVMTFEKIRTYKPDFVLHSVRDHQNDAMALEIAFGIRSDQLINMLPPYHRISNTLRQQFEALTETAYEYGAPKLYFLLLRKLLCHILTLSHQAPVILYGAGRLGIAMQVLMEDSVLGVIDQNSFDNVPNGTLPRILEMLPKNTPIIITVLGREEEITEMLLSRNIHAERIKRLLPLPQHVLRDFASFVSVMLKALKLP